MVCLILNYISTIQCIEQYKHIYQISKKNVVKKKNKPHSNKKYVGTTYCFISKQDVDIRHCLQHGFLEELAQEGSGEVHGEHFTRLLGMLGYSGNCGGTDSQRESLYKQRTSFKLSTQCVEYNTLLKYSHSSG